MVVAGAPCLPRSPDTTGLLPSPAFFLARWQFAAAGLQALHQTLLKMGEFDWREGLTDGQERLDAQVSRAYQDFGGSCLVLLSAAQCFLELPLLLSALRAPWCCSGLPRAAAAAHADAPRCRYRPLPLLLLQLLLHAFLLPPPPAQQLPLSPSLGLSTATSADASGSRSNSRMPQPRSHSVPARLCALSAWLARRPPTLGPVHAGHLDHPPFDPGAGGAEGEAPTHRGLSRRKKARTAGQAPMPFHFSDVESKLSPCGPLPPLGPSAVCLQCTFQVLSPS